MSVESEWVRKMPPQKTADELTYSQLRTALEHSLDKSFATRWQLKCSSGEKAEWVVLHRKELADQYERRRLHMLGRLSTDTWGKSQKSPKRSSSSSAYAFWHDAAEALEGESRLPDQCYEGLRSAADASLRVTLLCYQKIVNVPEGVEVASAKKYLRLERVSHRVCVKAPQHAEKDRCFASSLELHTPIPWLSDFVRTAAACQTGGYVIDCDQLWFRQFPPPAFTAPCWGHVCASLRMCCFRGTSASISKQKYLQYAKEPGDELNIATPFYFPKDSPVASGFVEWFRSTCLSRERPVIHEYNMCMQEFKRLFTVHGLETCILPERAFCPLAYHGAWNPKTKLFQAPMDAPRTLLLDAIRKESYGLNAAWCSSKRDEPSTMLQRCSLEAVERGSFWDRILTLSGGALRSARPEASKAEGREATEAQTPPPRPQAHDAAPEAAGYSADNESRDKALSLLEQRDAADARAATADEERRAAEARATIDYVWLKRWRRKYGVAMVRVAQLAGEKAASEVRAVQLAEWKAAAEACAVQRAEEKAAAEARAVQLAEEKAAAEARAVQLEQELNAERVKNLRVQELNSQLADVADWRRTLEQCKSQPPLTLVRRTKKARTENKDMMFSSFDSATTTDERIAHA